MELDRSTLTLITVVSVLASALASWSVLNSGGDPSVLGPLAFTFTAMTLGKASGGSPVVVLVRAVLLVIGGAVLLTGLALARLAGASLSLTTA